jgi:integral membrane protein
LQQKIRKFFRDIEQIRPFTEAEAWNLFRMAALAEGIGWLLLISGIYIRSLGGFGSGVAVPIAGRVHGIFFIAYFMALLAVSTSLRWRWRFVLLGLLAGVPPFGSIVFEQLMAYSRSNRRSRQHFRSIVLANLIASR